MSEWVDSSLERSCFWNPILQHLMHMAYMHTNPYKQNCRCPGMAGNMLDVFDSYINQVQLYMPWVGIISERVSYDIKHTYVCIYDIHNSARRRTKET